MSRSSTKLLAYHAVQAFGQCHWLGKLLQARLARSTALQTTIDVNRSKEKRELCSALHKRTQGPSNALCGTSSFVESQSGANLLSQGKPLRGLDPVSCACSVGTPAVRATQQFACACGVGTPPLTVAFRSVHLALPGPPLSSLPQSRNTSTRPSHLRATSRASTLQAAVCKKTRPCAGKDDAFVSCWHVWTM